MAAVPRRSRGGFASIGGYVGAFQDYFRFCVAFGALARYDLSGSGGERGSVDTSEAVRADRRKAAKILLFAAAATVVTSGIETRVRLRAGVARLPVCGLPANTTSGSPSVSMPALSVMAVRPADEVLLDPRLPVFRLEQAVVRQREKAISRGSAENRPGQTFRPGRPSIECVHRSPFHRYT